MSFIRRLGSTVRSIPDSEGESGLEGQNLETEWSKEFGPVNKNSGLRMPLTYALMRYVLILLNLKQQKSRNSERDSLLLLIHFMQPISIGPSIVLYPGADDFVHNSSRNQIRDVLSYRADFCSGELSLKSIGFD